MDETTLDPEYLKHLKPSFLHLFINFVKICNVISLFHKYNINVLTEIDVENIQKLSDKKGDREGSMLLFERLVLYKGWYDCLLQVLCDRDVRLSHVAHEMEVIKGLLDEKILSEESDDETQTTVEWLAGMSVLTSGLTTVLRVTPHTTNLNKLRVDPILEMRSLKLKIELDQLAGKMCELCKSSKAMLKQNEVLQTELDHLKMECCDRKYSYEKLHQEKEKLQTELDNLKMECSDRKDAYEKLHKEKEKEENKNKQQENIMREMECALQQCAVKKEKLEEKLKAYRQESAELQNKLEACHRARCAAEKILSDLKKELATIDIPSEKKWQLKAILDPNLPYLELLDEFLSAAIIPRSSLDGGLAPPTLPTIRSAGGSSKRTARNSPVRSNDEALSRRVGARRGRCWQRHDCHKKLLRKFPVTDKSGVRFL